MSEQTRRMDDDGLPTDVHERIQTAANRVQALRDATRSLGEEIARTRDAVEGVTHDDAGVAHDADEDGDDDEA